MLEKFNNKVQVSHLNRVVDMANRRDYSGERNTHRQHGFYARITGQDATAGIHTFLEQYITSAGALADLTGGRGSITGETATEPNGTVLATDTIVWISEVPADSPTNETNAILWVIETLVFMPSGIVTGNILYWDNTNKAWLILNPPASDGNKYVLSITDGVLSWNSTGPWSCPG